MATRSYSSRSDEGEVPPPPDSGEHDEGSSTISDGYESKYGPSYSAASRGGGGIEGIAHNLPKLTSIVVLGILLMLLGTLLLGFATSWAPPQPFDAKYDSNDNGNIDSGETDDYIRDRRSYAALQQGMRGAGNSIRILGVALIATALISGGILNKDLHNMVRLGMILSATLLLIFGLTIITQDLLGSSI